MPVRLRLAARSYGCRLLDAFGLRGSAWELQRAPGFRFTETPLQGGGATRVGVMMMIR